MESANCVKRRIEQDLHIPSLAINVTAVDRVNCIVPVDWCSTLNDCHRKSLEAHPVLSPVNISLYGRVTECDAKLWLSPSYTRDLPKNLCRVAVHVVPALDENATVESFTEVPFCVAKPNPSHAEVMCLLDQLSKARQQSLAELRYQSAIQLTSQPPQYRPHVMRYNQFIRESLYKLYGLWPLYLQTSSTNTAANRSIQFKSRPQHPSILSAVGIIETDGMFYIFLPFISYTVADMLTFSPARLSRTEVINDDDDETYSCTEMLYVLYQLLLAVRHLHRRGISVSDLSLRDVAIDDRLCVKVIPPNPIQLCKVLESNHESDASIKSPDDAEQIEAQDIALEETLTYKSLNTNKSPINHSKLNSSNQFHSNCSCLNDLHRYSIYQNDLPNITNRWVHGEISNYDYLMILNHLAGRNRNDPNHYPILPWVTDFSSSEVTGSYRDLSKTKYRINKGDQQLDLTYDSARLDSSQSSSRTALTPRKFVSTTQFHAGTPFHVSDFLSDITYYVYKARRTDKSVLCQVVRPQFVPSQYPATLRRLYEWTPDECIPEFYTDASLFTSLHSDLPDLELPEWAEGSPKRFIELHRALLEGEHVSQHLHDWIDLTFGYLLEGTAAVKAKNVCLQLVDNHKSLRNHGVVRLFSHPHPCRAQNCTTLAPRAFLNLISRRSTPADQMQKCSEIKQIQKFTKKLTECVLHFKTLTKKHDEFNSDFTHQHLPEASKNGTEVLKNGSAVESHADNLTEGPVSSTTGHPLRDLNRLEQVYEFSVKTCYKIPTIRPAKKSLHKNPLMHIISRDMQTVGCLIVELVCPSVNTIGNTFRRCHRLLTDDDSNRSECLCKRFEMARQVCHYHMSDIPGCLRKALLLLLDLSNTWTESSVDEFGAMFIYAAVNNSNLPFPNIDLLIDTSVRIIPFPSYFDTLFKVLSKITKHSDSIDHNSIKAMERVTLLQSYITRMSSSLGIPGINLLIPHVQLMLSDRHSSAQAAWSLFYPMAQALGPMATASHFLKSLISIFDTEQTSLKFMKLYHHCFVNQLIVKFGLELFCNTFCTLFIEGAARYKDFSLDIGNGNSNNNSNSNQYSTGEQTGKSFNNHETESRRLNRNSSAARISTAEYSLVNPSDSVDSVAEQTSQTSLGSGHSQENEGEFLLTQQEWDVMGEEQEAIELDREISEMNDLHFSESSLNSVSEDFSGPVQKLSQSRSRIMSSDTRSESNQAESVEKIVKQDSSVKVDEHNIGDVAADTIKWLAHRLGPVLTSKYLARNLLRMLSLCYIGDEQIVCIDTPLTDSVIGRSSRQIQGDINASLVLDCLSYIASLYGENVILLQYLTHVLELVPLFGRNMTCKIEGSLIGSLTLLTHMIPCVSDSSLMDVLKDTLLSSILCPILKTICSTEVSFYSGGNSRSVVAYRLIDVLYTISLRIGFDMTRQHLTVILQQFFDVFTLVYEGTGNSNALNIESVSQTSPSHQSSAKSTPGKAEEFSNLPERDAGFMAGGKKHKRQGSLGSFDDYESGLQAMSHSEAVDNARVMRELRDTFTPQMAHSSYIAFCKLAGSIHVEQHLNNDDLMRRLCAKYDQTLTAPPVSALTPTTALALLEEQTAEEMSEGLQVQGNKLVVISDESKKSAASSARTSASRSTKDRSLSQTLDSMNIRSSEMKQDQSRHLRGNWLAYWEHEVGRSEEREQTLNVKQIALQTFYGHSAGVRCLYVLDNENSFISASKDHTIKLWTLSNSGDGSAKVGCQWTYTSHKKSLLSMTFIDSVRRLASSDGDIHIWDPFLGVNIRQISSPKSMPVMTLTSVPAPSSIVMATSTDSMLRFVDARTGRYSHEFKSTVNPVGTIRCAAVSPSGNSVAVGFSTGWVSALDLRTGNLLSAHRAHENDILDIKFYDKHRYVTCSLDQTMCMWRQDETKSLSVIKGFAEPVNWLYFYRDCILSGNQHNKLYVTSGLDSAVTETVSTKLKSDMLKGSLSCAAVLPINRLLLISSDQGDIRLVA